MSQVQIVGNLPFPALVTDFVSAAEVSYRAPAPPVSRNEDLSFEAPSSSAPPSSTPHAPPPSTHQLLLKILEKVDRQGWWIEQIERRNKRRYNYLKELIDCTHPPLEEPDTPESTSDHSMERHDEPDSGSDDSNPTLLITDGTEDRAKL
ncbi:uncharacterized protein DS421_11g332470 [Arachis hypogaea]|nr:uncharacterized protein DS421_11g332470 [Arachis hypogaea]